MAGQAGGDGVAGDAVDEQEATGVAAQVVLVQRHGRVGRQFDAADVVHVEQAGGIVVAGDDVEAVSHRRDSRGHHLRTDVQQVGTAVRQRLLAGPHQVGGEPVGRLGLTGARSAEEVAAGDVDLAIEGDGHRLPDGRSLEITVVGDDAFDSRGLTRVGHGDHVARAHRAGHDRAAVAAEVALGPSDQLHRKPERSILDSCRGLPRHEGIEHCRPVVPGHVHRIGIDDVGAGDRTDGDCRHLFDAEPGGSGAHAAGEFFEGRVLVADQVHLVDGQHDAPDAHQGAHGQVPVGLRPQPTRGVDEQDRQVGGRSGHRHVAGVLLVARGVGDDHTPPAGQVEVPVGDVDGDALLTLGLEAVGQQGVVDLAHGDGRPAAARGARVLELVDGHRVGLDQQPPDEGGLAVIDRATGHHAQHGGLHVGRPGQGVGRGHKSRGHQK